MRLSRRTLMAWMGLAGSSALSTQWLRTGEAVAEDRSAYLPEISAADSPDVPGSNTRWERIASHKRELTQHVTWLTHEPIEFLLRRGDHSADVLNRYKRMLDPENIKRMAAAGVVYGRIFFYKGFGLDHERPHMEQARRAAEVMHSLGMKVSLYVGGTMFTETFYRESPQGEYWEQRDQWNRWVPYGIQTYRHYACPNEPAYREYLKRVLKVGIQELHADEIAFDNIMLQPEPHSCRCPRCIRGFAEFLKRRYPTSDAAYRRFGYTDTSWIKINEWDSSEQPQSIVALDDPVLQEWVHFRCESLANYSIDLYDYVKSLNPATAVLFNIKGIYSFNRYWTNAVYQPFFTGHIDLMAFDTGGYNSHIDPETGALVSQIRSYKMARRIGTSCEDAFSDDLRASVHMAFGYQKPGCVPAPFGSGAFNVFTPLLEFFREYNDRYYVGTQNVADVAVLRNWPSMAYSISATYVPATLMEQVLIQYKVPFDLLFDEELENLGKYRAVILAGQECISDAQAKLLMRYVRAGGVLMITGDVGRYNQWRELRAEGPFLPARGEGKGRIVVIPDIIRADAQAKRTNGYQDPEPGATAYHGVQLIPSQWVLPKNHTEIYKTLVANIPSGLTITTGAPLTTVMEILTRSESKETIVHFINFDRQKRTASFPMRLKKLSMPFRSVLCFSPERDQPERLTFNDSGQYASVAVPAFRTYSMIVVAT